MPGLYVAYAFDPTPSKHFPSTILATASALSHAWQREAHLGHVLSLSHRGQAFFLTTSCEPSTDGWRHSSPAGPFPGRGSGAIRWRRCAIALRITAIVQGL